MKPDIPSGRNLFEMVGGPVVIDVEVMTPPSFKIPENKYGIFSHIDFTLIYQFIYYLTICAMPRRNLKLSFYFRLINK